MASTPLELVVRFASSLPDQHITLDEPLTTSILGLKRRVRAHLPEDDKGRALRLIYGGRVLSDKASVAAAVGFLPPPPENASSSSDGPGKGKARRPPAPATYLHCAVSSVALTTEELAAEAAGATLAYIPTHDTPEATTSEHHEPSTAPEVRGFDRLGLAPDDLAALRAQHRSVVAARHTADAMPGQAEMLELEERWLEHGGRGDGEAGDGAHDDEHAAQLMDTLWGALMGFFWPVGCLVWGIREDGVLSRRRRDAVAAGIFINIGFAIMRVMSWAG